MGLIQLSSVVRPKTLTTSTISPKEKKGQSDHVQHQSQRPSKDTWTTYNIDPKYKAWQLETHVKLGAAIFYLDYIG